MNHAKTSGYQLVEITKKKDLLEFIRFPDRLYRGNPWYVPALHNAQLDTLSSERNPAFAHCQARYWLVRSEQQVLGRIAGIINHVYNKDRGIKYMRFGWLDFVEDPRVLSMLLGAVEAWARENQMEAVHGPLGFTSFDASGVLVEGFEELPTAWGRYNAPYYGPMLEEHGYAKDVDWVENLIQVPTETNQREMRIARMVRERFQLRQAEFKNRDELRMWVEPLFSLVNESYGSLYAFSALSPAQINQLADAFLKIVQAEFVSVVLNNQDEAVAFGLVVPSLAKAFQKARGRMFPLGYFHIMRALRYNDTVDMLLVGVKPEYQSRGAYALVFEKIFESMLRRGIRHVETTRELENNDKVQQLWAAYEKRQHKRARCYIKMAAQFPATL